MLALCLMLSSPYYAKNYAGIIDSGLADALFDGLLAAILDGFFTSTKSDYIGVVDGGGGEPQSGRENARYVVIHVLWIH